MWKSERAAVLAGILGVLLAVNTSQAQAPQAPWEQPRNPCAAKANPCAGKANPCNPCARGKANPCNPCNPCSKRGANPCNPCNPCGAGVRQAPEVESLIDEFLETGDAVRGRPGGEEKVDFPGPPGRPGWFQALAVTKDANPLLERECKAEAMNLSVETLQRATGVEDAAVMEAAAAHMQEHRDFIRANSVSYADYLKQIAECRSFCAPLVATLVRCHVLSVARLPHGIVGFGLDSADVDAGFASGILADVAERLDARPEDKVLLIGRASKIGDLRYNRRLSGQRALAVRDALVAKGVAGNRIEALWLGWEPPQIDQRVAKEYGLEDTWRSQGAQRINQSVILVTYPRGVPEPLS